MTNLLEEISQISIYIKDEKERVNEIALFHPLSRQLEFDEESKPVHQRKWSYTHKLPFLRRLTLKVQSFLFKKAPALIPTERLTSEAKFKTVIAILLAQEGLREFFFSNEKKKESFLQAAKDAAHAIGYLDFLPPSGQTPLKISQNMTLLSGKEVSLIDDLPELNLQMAALSHQERNEILFRILNQVERPPLTSVLEVMHGDEKEEILLKTEYAKYKIQGIDLHTGKIDYLFTENRSTSSIKTWQNTRPGVEGVINQRRAVDAKTERVISTYSGELETEHHLLEQILFMLNLQGEEVYLLNEIEKAEEQTFLFTSLYSWHEIDSLSDQHQMIRKINKKVLRIGNDQFIKLNLLHFNIPFNALNKYPSPAEMHAVIRDINDQGLIILVYDLWIHLGLHSDRLFQLKDEVEKLSYEKDYLLYQDQMLNCVDSFQTLKEELIGQLESLPDDSRVEACIALLKGKKRDQKRLRGIDLLLYLNTCVGPLNYLHNKNCENSTDNSAGASAADKAQYAYEKIYYHSFLPGFATEHETSLYKVLYSMYLVWEEPELNAALSTGFLGEKFYHNFLQRNPETTRYLIHWLKKHPEIYLGLSDQRI